MNARRVHELFRKNCPSIDFAQCDWNHLLPAGVLDETLLRQMVRTLDEENLFIHVQRKVGGVMPLEDGLTFIREHIGDSNIHLFDARFEHWVVIAQNGVGTVWSQAGEHLANSAA